MNSLWWFALPLLALPILWHRRKREQTEAEPMATARFLPRTEPRQVRTWRWNDMVLLLVRCLLLACAIAWLADPVLPWRGDTVIVVQGTDKAWAEQQIAQAGYGQARRESLPGKDALAWLREHEREWKPGARLLVLGDVPMPAAPPGLRHAVELRTRSQPFARSEHHVAIFSDRPDAWRRLFGAFGGARRVVVDASPGAKTELIVWDRTDAPPAGLRAPLWWVGSAAAFPELAAARSVDGLRYADSARGRLWSAREWPPQDAVAARRLIETWQRLHYGPVAYTAPSQVLAPVTGKPAGHASGALRDLLMMALLALFALERILTHARRR